MQFGSIINYKKCCFFDYIFQTQNPFTIDMENADAKSTKSKIFDLKWKIKTSLIILIIKGRHFIKMKHRADKQAHGH